MNLKTGRAMVDKTRLFWMDDAQWKSVAPLLRLEKSGPGRIEDRALISGIVHVLCTGCAWRDCPALYGSHLTIFRRFNYLKNRGTLTAILTAMNVEIKQSWTKTNGEHLTHVPRALANNERHRSPFGEVCKSETTRVVPQINDAVTERDVVIAHLKQIALVHQCQLTDGWIDAFVAWHLASLANARATSWIPGLPGNCDPFVREAVDRFRAHQMKNMVEKLTAEAHDLRLTLLEALSCIEYYAKEKTNNDFARITLRNFTGRLDDHQNEEFTKTPASNIRPA